MSEPRSAAARGDGAEFAHRSWPAHPCQLEPLRAEVRRWLAPSARAGDVTDDLVLAVGEAASNSIEHAYTPPTADDTVEVTFWTEPRAICVEIVDHGRWQPLSDPFVGGERGIAIMRRPVEFVLIRHDGRGTRVLLRHPLPRRPPRHSRRSAIPPPV